MLSETGVEVLRPSARREKGVVMTWGIVEWAEDKVDDAKDFVDGGIDKIGGGVSDGFNGFMGGLGDGLGLLGDGIGDGLGLIGDGLGMLGNLAKEEFNFGKDLTNDFIDVVHEEVIKPVEKTLEKLPEAAVDTLDWGLNAADSAVFDPVEAMTFGLVAPNYENGNLSAEVGVPGVLYGGATIGEGGIGARYEDLTFALGAHVGTDGSFGADSRAGLDIADLPGAKGHVEHGPNGEMSIGGHVQAIIPTPMGVVDGSANGGFQKNADGSWSTVHQADATLYAPSGAYSGNVNVQVTDDGHGNTDVNTGAGAGYHDYDGSGGNVDFNYMHDEEGDTTTDGVNLHGKVHADGVDVDEKLGVTQKESPDGSLTTITSDTKVDAGDVHVASNAQVQHEEKSDGTTNDSVNVTVDGEAAGNKFHGDGYYDHTDNADGSESESYGGHASAEGDDYSIGAGADHTYDRDAQGHETETTNAGINVKAGEFEGGGTYDHERRENEDGSVSEHTNVSGGAKYGDIAAGGTSDNVTETAADGTQTSVTHTSGYVDGVDLPGLPDGLDGPPTFDDLLNEVPTPQDAIDQIPTPQDAIDEIPTPDDLINQLPDAPDPSSLPNQIPGDIPGLGDLTDIPEVDQALSQLPDVSDVGLPDLGALADVPFADQLPTEADMVGALASTGDLSEVLGQVQAAVPDEAAGAIQAVATYVQDGNFDDFTGDVVGAEVNEAAADDVWDDLDQ